MASHFRFSSPLFLHTSLLPTPSILSLFYFLSLSLSHFFQWWIDSSAEVQGLVVVELQAEGCAQMAGELEARGGGWRPVSVCVVWSLSFLRLLCVEKKGEHRAGSVGGGGNSADWKIAVGWWSCGLHPLFLALNLLICIYSLEEGNLYKKEVILVFDIISSGSLCDKEENLHWRRKICLHW